MACLLLKLLPRSDKQVTQSHLAEEGRELQSYGTPGRKGSGTFVTSSDDYCPPPPEPEDVSSAVAD